MITHFQQHVYVLKPVFYLFRLQIYILVIRKKRCVDMWACRVSVDHMLDDKCTIHHTTIRPLPMIIYAMVSRGFVHTMRRPLRPQDSHSERDEHAYFLRF